MAFSCSVKLCPLSRSDRLTDKKRIGLGPPPPSSLSLSPSSSLLGIAHIEHHDGLAADEVADLLPGRVRPHEVRLKLAPQMLHVDAAGARVRVQQRVKELVPQVYLPPSVRGG